MTWSPRKKLIGCSAVAAVVLFAFALVRAWSTAWERFHVEDSISLGYRPLIFALEDYQRDNGVIATNLSQLVPRYLKALPNSPYVESIEYRVLTNGHWEISLRSRALNTPRLYVRRPTNEYSNEERERMQEMVHGWAIFLK